MCKNKDSMNMYISDPKPIIDGLNRLIQQSKKLENETKIEAGMTCISNADEYKKWLDDCRNCVCPIINCDEDAKEIYNDSWLIETQPIQAFWKFVKKLENLVNILS